MSSDDRDEVLGVCTYMLLPHGPVDRTVMTREQCVQAYNGNGYIVVSWEPIGPSDRPMPGGGKDLDSR